ncbi:MAG: AAA family ATPase [Sulfurimonas sp.]|uniref:AAA family ATPase n=1 Tax=Sulfurimonas sp. TaxID=2022749 RepID=UPI003D0BF099
MKKVGTLIFFCGKMGAGKSTKSKEFSVENNAVLISEDEWLSTLYPQQISSFDDYIKYSALLRPLIKSHVQKILLTGANVVLDFPANTTKQRAWLKSITKEIDAKHQLIYLEVSNEQCIKQIAKRRLEQPDRSAFDTEEMFYHVTKYFEIPLDNEGLEITVIGENI